MDHSRRRPHTPSKSERLRDQRHVRQRELAGALIPRLQLKRGVWGFCLLLKLKEAPKRAKRLEKHETEDSARWLKRA